MIMHKKIIQNIFTIVTLCFFVCLQARIVQHAHIAEIAQYIQRENPDTLIIFDIDHTIIKPKGWVGGPIWFEHMIQKKMGAGFDEKTSHVHVLDMLLTVEPHIHYQLVEEAVSTVFEICQKSGATVIALTARSLCLTERTLKQLTKHRIHFTLSTFTNAPTMVSHQHFHYHNGIIFCCSYSKGKPLIAACKHMHYWPKKIIYIDDSLHSLIAVRQEIANADPSIEFIGIHYTHLEHLHTQFDELEAEKELCALLAHSRV